MTATNTYGRQVVVPLTNKSGGGVIAGDVVVIDTTNNDSFTTSTAGSVTGTVGIAQETIASNAVGRVLTDGYAALVNVNASVTRGNYGKTHTVAKQATDAGASRVAGTFCQFLTGGTTPDAMVWHPDLGAGGGTGALVFLEAHTAATSATLDFTTFVSGTYDTYKIIGTELIIATNTSHFQMEVGTGGGPTWDTGNNYEWSRGAYTTGGSGTGTVDFASTAVPRIFATMANAAGYGFGQFELMAYALQSTSIRKSFLGQVYYVTSVGPAAVIGPLGIQWTTAGTAVTALRFLASSGNITSGTIRIYGVSKS
jgi:hypothetical protein